MSEKYTIYELLEELRNDPSWEEDPATREMIADTFLMNLIGLM